MNQFLFGTCTRSRLYYVIHIYLIQLGRIQKKKFVNFIYICKVVVVLTAATSDERGDTALQYVNPVICVFSAHI